MESFAKIPLGQTTLKLIDRVLWVVEKSVQWSLPVQEASSDENGKTFGEVELVRPLPWILFLPGLILLRAVRIALNVGAFVCGYPLIQPSGIVKYVQKRRRQLRTIKNNGLKSMRIQKEITDQDKVVAKNDARKSLIKSIQLTLSTLSCLDGYRNSPSPPPTRIQVSNNFDLVPVSIEENSTIESTNSPNRSDSKRKFFEVEAASTDDDDDGSESEDETLTSQIERLALEKSIDDPDFNPDALSLSDATDASFEDEVSITEAKELMADAKKDLKLIQLQNSEQSEQKEKPISDEKSKVIVTPENSGNNHGVEALDGQENYYSPVNFGTDGELAFYSPISSKSVSPERSNSPIKQIPIKGSNAKSSDIGNGALKTNEELIFPGFQKKTLQMVTLREKNRRTVENSTTNIDVSVMEIVKKSN
ncbi:uncharacterized protein LOC127290278 isoform X2 [Leptopilina boulardi]|uniref:uncharacterized protein LOC127290278 isoform X2 n=1 Tax=Leptopilina boulardi TaxID=63433 RepID=UPI0021F666CB|nr:uncharacterized protein LOC127290278 isoform X2 [Leptopilina boulardi]